MSAHLFLLIPSFRSFRLPLYLPECSAPRIILNHAHLRQSLQAVRYVCSRARKCTLSPACPREPHLQIRGADRKCRLFFWRIDPFRYNAQCYRGKSLAVGRSVIWHLAAAAASITFSFPIAPTNSLDLSLFSNRNRIFWKFQINWNIWSRSGKCCCHSKLPLQYVHYYRIIPATQSRVPLKLYRVFFRIRSSMFPTFPTSSVV